MAAIDLLMKTAIVLRSGGGGQTTKQPGVEVIVLLVEGIRPIDPPPAKRKPLLTASGAAVTSRRSAVFYR